MDGLKLSGLPRLSKALLGSQYRKKIKAYNYETELYLGTMKWFWQGDIKKVTGYKAPWSWKCCKVSRKHSIKQQKTIPSLCDYGEPQAWPPALNYETPWKKCSHSFKTFDNKKEKLPIRDKIGT